MFVYHLVVDIESVIDHSLVGSVGGQFLEMREKGEFLPYFFHVPKVIGVASVFSDFSIQRLGVIPATDKASMVRAFWDGWRRYEEPQIITYNGRGFDLPLLEAHALKEGVQVPAWFRGEFLKSYEDPRNRYNTSKHLDLADWVSNFRAAPIQGGLDLLAKFLDLPGKFGSHGSESEQLSEKELIAYCLCDVLDTYFIWLHTRVVMSEISMDRFHELFCDTLNRVVPEAIERCGLEGTQLETYQRELMVRS